MKNITLKNILTFIKLKKEYEAKKSTKKLDLINDFINNIINKDKRYYSKITGYYNTSKIKYEDLKYLL